MHKLPKDGAVKAAWINTILKGRKQLIQESLHTYVMASLLSWLINPRPVFNKISPRPVRQSQCGVSSIVKWGYQDNFAQKYFACTKTCHKWKSANKTKIS